MQLTNYYYTNIDNNESKSSGIIFEVEDWTLFSAKIANVVCRVT